MQIGSVHRMIQSPNDDQLVVFLGKFESSDVSGYALNFH